MSSKLDRARQKFVLREETKITFGGPSQQHWWDAEADEVDFGKEQVGDEMRWDQWAGIVERGRPQSLILFKTPPKLTKPRAAGPGPITGKDWAPMAKKHLQGRKTLLRTGGARACELGMNREEKLDGVVHDYGVHGLKKQGSGNKFEAAHGGTQIVDRCWRCLRKHIGARSFSAAGAPKYSARVRAAQWRHWRVGSDHWGETGGMFRALL
ncbi:unnamed protein product [Prorocentrum cordatum]|uniref:Uncharacterized protein n=1 Tax=Prorocentrum cordatum TaxID=2364126 RepID=A0ABN9VVD2_9DINO|nr:unnamed protein product [Polarella glacialis]